MSKNNNLHSAKKAKNDEFYTLLEDIEKEMVNYVPFFEGKVVYCNCDDYRISNFTKCFKDNFEYLKLKKVICTNYDNGNGSWKYEYDGENETIAKLDGNGSFDSEECVELLNEADVVVTNPPFSKMRQFFNTLVNNGYLNIKYFLFIGTQNMITYKNVFQYIKDEKMFLGYNHPNTFKGGEGYEKAYVVDGETYIKINSICWFTNIENKKRNQPLDLYRKYNPTDYPKYDNYCAFNVDKVAEIPEDDYIDIEIDEEDYPKWKAAYGDDVEILENKIRIHRPVWGTPITFLDKYCHKQFMIVGWSRHNDIEMDGGYWQGGKADATINGKEVYRRILIRKLV